MALMDSVALATLGPDARLGGTPWPHLVASPFDPALVADGCAEVTALPREAFAWEIAPRIQKGTLPDVWSVGPSVQRLWEALNRPELVGELRRISGLDDLQPDPAGTFAGVFVTPAGGWQRVHEDFPTHPVTGLWHRVVALLYLSEWRPGSGGELELWDPSMTGEPALLAPEAGRMVVFMPSGATLHGVRQLAPDAGPRVAIAARYYSSSPPTEVPRSPARRTVRRPGERRRDIRPAVGDVLDYVLGRGLNSRAARRSAPIDLTAHQAGAPASLASPGDGSGAREGFDSRGSDSRGSDSRGSAADR